MSTEPEPDPAPPAVPSTPADASSEAQAPERDAIDACLHRHGVHDGFPRHRRALAIQCQFNGITVEDLDMLAESVAWQRKATSDSVPALMVTILREPEAAKVRLADMRLGRSRRAAAKTGKTYPGESYFRKSFDDIEGGGRDRIRDLRIAHAVIYSDRRPAEMAAEMLGCTPAEAMDLAERYRRSVLGESGAEKDAHQT